MHVRKSPTAYLLFLVMLCLGASVTSACTADQRRDTLRASLTGVNAARDGFVAWDASHQQQLVAEATTLGAGEEALKSYRASREKVRDGFVLAYQALAVAATQTDDPSLQAALARAGDLIAAVKAFMGSL
jgi:hypothetical protein